MTRPLNADARVKPRVLVVADAWPAQGGISSFATRLSEDATLRQSFDVRLLNTTRQASWKGGAFTLLTVRRALLDIVSVARAARTSKLTHLQTALLPTLPLLRVTALGLAARLVGSRVIVHAHTGLTNSGPYEGFDPTRTQRLLLGLLDRLTSLVVLVSVAGQRGLSPWMRRTRLEVLLNGIDVRGYSRSETRDEQRVVYAGALGVGKGVLDLLDAVRELDLPPGKLLVIGGANQRGADEADYIRKQYEAAGYASSLRGEMSDEQVKEALTSAGTVVLPSHSEGHPLIVLEAMASGVPVLATKVGGIPETITDGVEGLLVPPRSPHLLAESLERLISDRDLRMGMGEAARQRAETEFSWPAFRGRLIELYESCLTNP